MADEGKVTCEMRIGYDRIMVIGIYGIVDGVAICGAQPRVVLHDRITATIGEDEIVLGD